VVNGTAGFHDDAIDVAVIEEAAELRAGESVSFDDPMIALGKGDLEDVLCQIDRGGSRMNVELLSIVTLTPHP